MTKNYKYDEEKVCCKNCVNFFEANAFNWPEYDCLKSGRLISFPEALTHCKDFVNKKEINRENKQ